MFDGYVFGNLNNNDVRSAVSFYERTLKDLGVTNIDNSDAILYKEVPSVGKFYRIIYSKFTKYSITIFVNTRGQMSIIGVSSLPYYFPTINRANLIKSFGILSDLIKISRAYFQSQNNSQVIKDPIIKDYDASQDYNCLRYKNNECLKCLYRYYLKGGVCYAIPD